MTEAMKSLLADAAVKASRAQELLSKGSLNDEEVVEVTSLNTDLAAYREKAEGMKTLDDNRLYIDGLANAAVKSVPHPGSDISNLGTARAGTAFIDTKTGEMEHDGNEGMLNVKQFQNINNSTYRKAFVKLIQEGGIERRLPEGDQKALTEGLDAGGGYLVPPQDLAQILSKEPAPQSLAAQVSSITCNRDRIIIPKINYTTNNIYSTGMRATWTGEIPSSSSAARVTDPVFGIAEIPIFTCMATLPISNDFLEDTSIDIMAWIRTKVAEFIGLLDEDMIINGTGVSQPMGLVASTHTTVDTEVAGKITCTAAGASSLLSVLVEEMPFKLAQQYHGNAKWLFNLANAGLKIFKLKDSQNRPYFGGGLYDMSTINGAYRQLLGFPAIVSALMPNMGADAFPLYFGDFKGYYFARRIGVSVTVLNEILAETNQKLLVLRYRVGGAPAEEWRMLAGKTPS